MSWILSEVRQRQIKILGAGDGLASNSEWNSKTTSAVVNPQDEHLAGSPTALGSGPNSAVFRALTWNWALNLSGFGPQVFISLSVM